MMVDVIRLSSVVETSLDMQTQMPPLCRGAVTQNVQRSRLGGYGVWNFLKHGCREEREEKETSVAPVTSVMKTPWAPPASASATSQRSDPLHPHPRKMLPIQLTLTPGFDGVACRRERVDEIDEPFCALIRLLGDPQWLDRVGETLRADQREAEVPL